MNHRKHSYKGNILIKMVGHVHEFTAHQIEELIKCQHDYIYFIETYCQIVSLDKGLVPFVLYEYQKRVIHAMHDNRMFVLMMPRQMGKSSCAAGYILWYTLFQENKTVAILANKKAASLEVMDRYQTMYEHLPIWLQQGVRTFNAGDVELENGSKVFTSATTLSSIRGKSVNLLYIDEFAMVPETLAEEFISSVYPTISSGKTTKLLVTSTPQGYNHFWSMWKKAETQENGFVRMYVPYTEHPDRDEAWAKRELALMGNEVRFQQEYGCEFLGSAQTLINGRTLATLKEIGAIESIHDGSLLIYKSPEPEHIYALIVDVSQGLGQDYSAFSVIDITTTPYEMVARFRDNNVVPLLFPNYIFESAKAYNNAHVLIELNDSGRQVADILHDDLEYENILTTMTENSKTFISPGFSTSVLPGVKTNKTVKKTGCWALKTLVENKKLLIFDFQTIFELSTFVLTKGSYAAAEGKHDDLAMTLVLFGWLTTNQYFQELTDVNLRNRLFEAKMAQIENEMLPLALPHNGMEEEEPFMDDKNTLWSTAGKYEPGFFGENWWRDGQ